MILDATGEPSLVSRQPILRQTTERRNPYVDALSLFLISSQARVRELRGRVRAAAATAVDLEGDTNDGPIRALERATELVRQVLVHMAEGQYGTG